MVAERIHGCLHTMQVRKLPKIAQQYGLNAGKGGKTVKWINNYHRGFNRVWLIVSVIVACLVVAYLADEGKYRVGDKPYLKAILLNLPSDSSYWTQTDWAKFNRQWTEQEWDAFTEQDWARYWKAEETYSNKIWNARLLGVFHFLLIFVIIFAIGHGSFYLVTWMIRGFIKQ